MLVVVGVGVGVGVVGVGGGGGVEEGLGGDPPEPKFHVPVKTPAETSAKNSKRPSDKSRPPKGQPGHSSTIRACADFPLTVMVIVWKQ